MKGSSAYKCKCIFLHIVVTNIESQSTDYKRITCTEAVHKVRIFLMAGYIDKAGQPTEMFRPLKNGKLDVSRNSPTKTDH